MGPKYKLIIESFDEYRPINPGAENPYELEDGTFETEDALFYYIGDCLGIEIPYRSARDVILALQAGRLRVYLHLVSLRPFKEKPWLTWAVELVK